MLLSVKKANNNHEVVAAKIYAYQQERTLLQFAQQ